MTLSGLHTRDIPRSTYNTHSGKDEESRLCVSLSLSLRSLNFQLNFGARGGGKEELRTETIDTLRQVTTHTHHVACMPYGPHAATPVDHTLEATAQHIRSFPMRHGSTHNSARGTSSSPTMGSAKPAGTVLEAIERFRIELD